MDLLKRAALTYEELCGKIAKVTFSNGQSIAIKFERQNFIHLAGLRKYSDLYFTQQKLSAYTLFQQILKDKITFDDLRCSRFHSAESRERIEGLCRIREVLFSGRAVYGFDPKSCSVRSNLRSSVIFYLNDAYSICMTLGVANGGEYYYPETFFLRYDDAYTKGQNKVGVDSVTFE